MEALIIPFPKAVSREAGQEVLRRALEDLQSALADQQRALSDWRFAMAELGIGVAGLGHSLISYQDSLGGVETGLAELRAESGRLQDWAAATAAASSAGR